MNGRKIHFWLITTLFLLTAVASCKPNRQEDTVAEATIINSKKYADARNSSYLDVTGRLGGNQVWEKKSLYVDDLIPADQLAIIDTFLVISYGNYINVRSQKTGESIWSKEMFSGALFDLKANGLVAVDENGYYEILGMDQKINEHLSLPFLSSQTMLFFSRKNDNEMAYCYQTYPTATNSPTDSFGGPEMTFNRFDIKSDDFIWQFIKKEDLIEALIAGDGSFYCLVTLNHIYLIDSEATSDDGVTTIDIEEAVSAAIDHQGNVLLIENTEEGRFLKSFNRQGEISWEFPMEEAELTGQPPASHPDGSVYIVLDDKLIKIESGKEVWSCQLMADAGEARITVLKDGTILAAANSVLMQISPDGEITANEVIPEPITCRPIMDNNGLIYVTGATGVRCLR